MDLLTECKSLVSSDKSVMTIRGLAREIGLNYTLIQRLCAEHPSLRGMLNRNKADEIEHKMGKLISEVEAKKESMPHLNYKDVCRELKCDHNTYYRYKRLTGQSCQ